MERRAWLLAQARELGFDQCGVAPAADFNELAHLPEWLARGYAGEMHYLHDARRQSPQAAMPGARSIIICALNYNTALPYSTDARGASVAPPFRAASATRPGDAAGLKPGATSNPKPSATSASSAVNPSDSPRGWISRYAWGDDYHNVLGAKLDALLAAMRAEFAEPFDARAYVDTGPVVERVAAHHAGLGWLAKNTCLINEQLGSWLFLGVILTTLELAPSLAPAELPPADLCGNCTQCIDACPTGAIVEPYLLDARRCISYLTIELRGPIPEEFHAAMGWHVFGCDICQDVCPFNRRAPVTDAREFQPRLLEAGSQKFEIRPPTSDHPVAQSLDHPIPDSLFNPSLEKLAVLSEEDFRALFRGSAIRRTKHAGLTRNAAIARKNM